MDSIKINKLEIENVKRIKAVKIEPSRNGLTIVGGDNNQGKTSVLDSIAWALGGEKYRPSQAQREGSVTPPNLHIVMSNGLVVERKGKNSSLKVTDPDGNKSGQQLLNEFVEQLALDLPKFMESSGKEKARRAILQDDDINISDRLLESLVKDDAESTKSAVEEFASLFRAEVGKAVKEALKGEEPKAGGSSTLTKEQILAVKDRTERQRLIRDNMNLFK